MAERKARTDEELARSHRSRKPPGAGENPESQDALGRNPGAAHLDRQLAARRTPPAKTTGKEAPDARTQARGRQAQPRR